MYREPNWSNGFYIDNHKKYKCHNCDKEFIVGERMLEDCQNGFPVCPYCGEADVECIVWTEEEQLSELAASLGCLAIYIDEDI